MSQVLPAEADHMPAVASLFQRVFRDERQAAPADLEAYLRRHYLEAPGCDPQIGPLVHLADDGAITGFLGVTALPMTFGERRLRAAVCGALMADPRAQDRLAAPRLLKAFLAGPQDLSLSETASEVSAQMWTRLRGIALPGYSLDWVRVIRPLAFMTEQVASRLGFVGLAAPLARAADGRLRRRLAPQELRWWGVPDQRAVKGGLAVADLDRAGFAALVEPLTRHFDIRPCWSEAQLAHILEEAADKPAFGEAVFGAVRTAGGTAIGAFAYHGRPGRTARVLQILAMPGHAGPVIDCLIRHATERGATALRGRTQPALLEAMLERRIALLPIASTVIHARDKAIVEMFRDGRGFLNGLAGEHWSALSGGRFG